MALDRQARPGPAADETTPLLGAAASPTSTPGMDSLSPDRSRTSAHSSASSASARSTSTEGTIDAVTTAVARHRLYVSHFLTTWNSRVFEFGSMLYLAALFQGTLLPISVYALTRGLAGILLASAEGYYIDNGNRLQVVRLSIVLQRLAVAASCAVFYVLAADLSHSHEVTVALLVLLCLLACAEKVGSDMNMTAVEMDWVPAMCDQNKAKSRILLAKMRRIDLICKVFGPLFISNLEAASTKITILVNLAMNILSIPMEYIAIARVYHKDPRLQMPKTRNLDGSLRVVPTEAAAISSLAPVSETEHEQQGGGNTPYPPQSSSWLSWCLGRLRAFVTQMRQDFSMHRNHDAFLPSFANALTYFTVLSFSGRMVTYLLSMGYNSQQIAVSRTVSVVFEVSATWVAPWVMGHIGNIRAALWFSSWQLFWLATGLGASWVMADRGGLEWGLRSAMALVAGTVLSRTGLFGFDQCVQNLVQSEVAEDRRGTFSSVEKAYANLFEMLSYLTTLVFSQPDQFKWPSLLTVLGIFGAWCIQAVFVRSKRGHLIHIPGEKYYRQRVAAAQGGGPWYGTYEATAGRVGVRDQDLETGDQDLEQGR